MRLLILILSIACINLIAKEITVEQINEWRIKAQQGDAVSQNNLGVVYSKGIQVPKDEVEGMQWYRKSAEQGFEIGQFNLGQCYDKGQGILKDQVEAAKWFRRAAEQGDLDAIYMTGIKYFLGEGVPEDHVEGYAYVNVAAVTNVNARELRETWEKVMPQYQILAGQRRSKELQRQIQANIIKKASK